MFVNIVPIGNSKGIRIPKLLLDQCGFEEKVEVKVKNKTLILSAQKPRLGWKKVFGKQSANEKVEYIESEWDNREWEW